MPSASGTSGWRSADRRPQVVGSGGSRCRVSPEISASACGSAGHTASRHSATAVGLPGSDMHEAVPRHSDDLPRQHRVRRRREALLTHHLRHPGNLVVEHRDQRLRCHIAWTEAGAAGEDQNVSQLDASAHHCANALDVIGDALAGDDIGREQREPRHDDIATAVIRVDTTPAIADGDLGATPASSRWSPRSFANDALVTRVDIHLLAAKEADQRHPRVGGELHGEARRSGNRCQQRDSRHQRLLRELEARAS